MLQCTHRVYKLNTRSLSTHIQSRTSDLLPAMACSRVALVLILVLALVHLHECSSRALMLPPKATKLVDNELHTRLNHAIVEDGSPTQQRAATSPVEMKRVHGRQGRLLAAQCKCPPPSPATNPAHGPSP